MITRNGIDVGQVITNTKNDFINTLLTGTSFPANNILHQYRTFNYRITLAIISNAEYESQSYKLNGFDYIVLQSHGKALDNNANTNSNTLNKIQSFVNILGASGKNNYNFYIDDLYIKNYVAGSKDIATEIKMKVIEPYGIDTFLKTIISGLSAKGYYTLDKGVNFVMKIDFVGYREESDDPEVVPYSTRYYPIVITKLDANLSEKGTVYDITAAPMNDMGRLDDVNAVKDNISLVGNTVQEFMKDLENKLNELGKSSKDTTYIPNTLYEIEWQDSEFLKEIKESPMFDVFQESGMKQFLKDKAAYVEVKKSTVTTKDANDVEKTNTVITVDGRAGLTNLIDGIILESKYSVDRVKAEFKGYYNKDGHINWWRVIPKIRNGKWIKTQNRHQKIVTFLIVTRVVPFSKVTTIFRPDHVTKPDDFETLVARNYEWNYTGNNKDIISFNLNFNQLWTKIITGDYGQKPESYGASKMSTTERKQNEAKGLETTSAVTNNDTANISSASGSVTTANGSTNASIVASTTTTDTKGDSSKKNQIKSSAETDPFFDLTRDIGAIINNPYEQVSMTMEILGDPMWLGTQYIDSKSTAQGSSLFTVDGGIAIRTVDPVVRVIAYAPTDFNAQGFLAPEVSMNRSLSMYSAYYTIYEIENFFQNGVFKQKIKGYRNTQQDLSKLASGDRFTKDRIDLSIRRGTE